MAARALGHAIPTALQGVIPGSLPPGQVPLPSGETPTIGTQQPQQPTQEFGF